MHAGQVMTKKQKLFTPVRHLRREFIVSRAAALFTHPLFWFLTIVGNGSMVLGALGFYWLEHDTNPRLTLLDALWWSVATVTSVGYGDVTPITPLGKIAGMGLMIFGTALFGSFTALFAATLLEPEISEVEREVKELEKRVH